MRRKYVALIAALATALALAVPAGAAKTTAAIDDAPVNVSDSLDGPFSKQQAADRAEAMEMLLNGKIKKGKKVAKLPNGHYVELEREATDNVFVIIAEFDNNRHPSYPDAGSDGTPLTYEGPLHNSIPEPDRSVDNTTLWQPDYGQAHYEDMYFNRMADYYERQSSGRYSVEGEVTEWVKVPFNEARYGRDLCGGIVCNNTWFLIRDAMAVWVEDQLASGLTLSEVTDYLETFDVWDRYDADGDGDFDEPDGFIDHFQIVHAGGDQAAGDKQQGSDAIWSHRWYASIYGGGPNGFPGVNAGIGGLSGGLAIPNNPTGVWVGDYTIQPENGGLGVFAHEYAHDLGLPDLYDTSGNTGGAENSTGFWTLMASGANIGDGGCCGIGDAPVDLGAWEKFQLGWLNYDVAFAGETSTHNLGPAEFNTKYAQGLFVVLPPKEVTEELAEPFAGDNFYYSGAGNDYTSSMSRTVTLPAGSPQLTAMVNYDIEFEWDFAFVTVDGATIPTSLSTAGDQGGLNPDGHGITGLSADWVPLTADLSAYAGTTVDVGFLYLTDGAVVNPGFMVDEIMIGTEGPFGAEVDDEFTLDGFTVTTGTETAFYNHYYLVENRSYKSYDSSLKTAYNFGFLDSLPDWVEFFSYQPGALINYWDTSQTDNNVGDHPGEGLILPIDAHPTFHHYYDGTLLRPRILSFDSTFGKKNTESITVHKDSQPTVIPKQDAVPIFDDTLDWWFNADEHAATGSHVGRYQPGWVGVKVPNTGTTISVVSGNPNGAFMTIEVAPK